MAITHIALTISTDSDKLVGEEGWGEFDASASLNAFASQVANALHGAYGCPVTVRQGLNKELYITTDDDSDTEAEQEDIRLIQDDVWAAWDWLVK